MGRVILITGGSRSGKSRFSQEMAEGLPGDRALVATCPILDDETRDRVARHQAARAGKGWHTIEEPVHLKEVIETSQGMNVLLVDCLTLWVNNLLYEAMKSGETLSEEDIAKACADLVQSCRQRKGTFLFVTNEVGWGIVPEAALTRRFRDLAGRCNQVMASGADEVYLVVCGQPLRLKGEHGGPTSR